MKILSADAGDIPRSLERLLTLPVATWLPTRR
jgi:hypothetical protein